MTDETDEKFRILASWIYDNTDHEDMEFALRQAKDVLELLGKDRKETITETRARFRKEFPEIAKYLDYIYFHHWETMWSAQEAFACFNAFAVGAGHPKGVKFKEEAKNEE